MKSLPKAPQPGCAGESLRILAQENEMAKAIETVLFEPPKPPPPKKPRSSEGRPALCL